MQNGLIYVVDIDLGLFILRYTGKGSKEIAQAAFVEGNSSPSRYTKKDPVIRRPAAGFTSWSGPATYVRDRFADVPLPKDLKKAYGFFCVL